MVWSGLEQLDKKETAVPRFVPQKWAHFGRDDNLKVSRQGKHQRAEGCRFTPKTQRAQRAISIFVEIQMSGEDAGRVRIGVSGWQYPPWRGVFYPKMLPQKKEMPYCGQVFSTVEINGSFYSLQRPFSYQRWREETPMIYLWREGLPVHYSHAEAAQRGSRASELFCFGAAGAGVEAGTDPGAVSAELYFPARGAGEFLQAAAADDAAGGGPRDRA